MTLAPDKILHLKGGAVVALFAFAIAAFQFLVLTPYMHPIVQQVSLAVTCVACAIEGMQWVENRAGLARRDVSVKDWLATALPGYALCVLFEIALRCYRTA